MKEEYKDIPNYEGIYQVSNKGNVKNILTKLKIKKQYISACCLNKINKTHGFIFKYEEGLN